MIDVLEPKGIYDMEQDCCYVAARDMSDEEFLAHCDIHEAEMLKELIEEAAESRLMPGMDK